MIQEPQWRYGDVVRLPDGKLAVVLNETRWPRNGEDLPDYWLSLPFPALIREMSNPAEVRWVRGDTLERGRWP